MPQRSSAHGNKSVSTVEGVRYSGGITPFRTNAAASTGRTQRCPCKNARECWRRKDVHACVNRPAKPNPLRPRELLPPLSFDSVCVIRSTRVLAQRPANNCKPCLLVQARPIGLRYICAREYLLSKQRPKGPFAANQEPRATDNKTDRERACRASYPLGRGITQIESPHRNTDRNRHTRDGELDKDRLHSPPPPALVPGPHSQREAWLRTAKDGSIPHRGISLSSDAAPSP